MAGGELVEVEELSSSALPSYGRIDERRVSVSVRPYYLPVSLARVGRLPLL